MNIIDSLENAYSWKTSKHIKRIGKTCVRQFVIEFKGGSKIIVEADEDTPVCDYNALLSMIRL